MTARRGEQWIAVFQLWLFLGSLFSPWVYAAEEITGHIGAIEAKPGTATEQTLNAEERKKLEKDLTKKMKQKFKDSKFTIAPDAQIAKDTSINIEGDNIFIKSAEGTFKVTGGANADFLLVGLQKGKKEFAVTQTIDGQVVSRYEKLQDAEKEKKAKKEISSPTPDGKKIIFETEADETPVIKQKEGKTIIELKEIPEAGKELKIKQAPAGTKIHISQIDETGKVRVDEKGNLKPLEITITKDIGENNPLHIKREKDKVILGSGEVNIDVEGIPISGKINGEVRISKGHGIVDGKEEFGLRVEGKNVENLQIGPVITKKGDISPMLFKESFLQEIQQVKQTNEIISNINAALKAGNVERAEKLAESIPIPAEKSRMQQELEEIKFYNQALQDAQKGKYTGVKEIQEKIKSQERIKDLQQDIRDIKLRNEAVGEIQKGEFDKATEIGKKITSIPDREKLLSAIKELQTKQPELVAKVVDLTRGLTKSTKEIDAQIRLAEKIAGIDRAIAAVKTTATVRGTQTKEYAETIRKLEAEKKGLEYQRSLNSELGKKSLEELKQQRHGSEGLRDEIFQRLPQKARQEVIDTLSRDFGALDTKIARTKNEVSIFGKIPFVETPKETEVAALEAERKRFLDQLDGLKSTAERPVLEGQKTEFLLQQKRGILDELKDPEIYIKNPEKGRELQRTVKNIESILAARGDPDIPEAVGKEAAAKSIKQQTYEDSKWMPRKAYDWFFGDEKSGALALDAEYTNKRKEAVTYEAALRAAGKTSTGSVQKAWATGTQLEQYESEYNAATKKVSEAEAKIERLQRERAEASVRLQTAERAARAPGAEYPEERMRDAAQEEYQKSIKAVEQAQQELKSAEYVKSHAEQARKELFEKRLFEPSSYTGVTDAKTKDAIQKANVKTNLLLATYLDEQPEAVRQEWMKGYEDIVSVGPVRYAELMGVTKYIGGTDLKEATAEFERQRMINLNERINAQWMTVISDRTGKTLEDLSNMNKQQLLASGVRENEIPVVALGRTNSLLAAAGVRAPVFDGKMIVDRSGLTANIIGTTNFEHSNIVSALLEEGLSPKGYVQMMAISGVAQGAVQGIKWATRATEEALKAKGFIGAANTINRASELVGKYIPFQGFYAATNRAGNVLEEGTLKLFARTPFVGKAFGTFERAIIGGVPKEVFKPGSLGAIATVTAKAVEFAGAELMLEEIGPYAIGRAVGYASVGAGQVIEEVIGAAEFLQGRGKGIRAFNRMTAAQQWGYEGRQILTPQGITDDIRIGGTHEIPEFERRFALQDTRPTPIYSPTRQLEGLQYKLPDGQQLSVTFKDTARDITTPVINNPQLVTHDKGVAHAIPVSNFNPQQVKQTLDAGKVSNIIINKDGQSVQYEEGGQTYVVHAQDTPPRSVTVQGENIPIRSTVDPIRYEQSKKETTPLRQVTQAVQATVPLAGIVRTGVLVTNAEDNNIADEIRVTDAQPDQVADALLNAEEGGEKIFTDIAKKGTVITARHARTLQPVVITTTPLTQGDTTPVGKVLTKENPLFTQEEHYTDGQRIIPITRMQGSVERYAEALEEAGVGILEKDKTKVVFVKDGKVQVVALQDAGVNTVAGQNVIPVQQHVAENVMNALRTGTATANTMAAVAEHDNPEQGAAVVAAQIAQVLALPTRAAQLAQLHALGAVTDEGNAGITSPLIQNIATILRQSAARAVEQQTGRKATEQDVNRVVKTILIKPKEVDKKVEEEQKEIAAVKPLPMLTFTIGEQTFSLPQLKTDKNIDSVGLLRLIANTAEWPVAEQKIKEVLAENGLEEGVVVDSDGDIVLYVKDNAGILKKVGVKAFERAVSEQLKQPVSCGFGSGLCAGKGDVYAQKFPHITNYLTKKGISSADVATVFNIPDVSPEDILEIMNENIAGWIDQGFSLDEIVPLIDQAIEAAKIGRHLLNYPVENYGTHAEWLAAVAREEKDERGRQITKTTFLDAFRHSLMKLAQDHLQKKKPTVPVFSISSEELRLIKFRDIPLWMSHTINGKQFRAYSTNGQRIILLHINEKGQVVETVGAKFELREGRYVVTKAISPEMYPYGLNEGVLAEIMEKYNQLAPYAIKVNNLKTRARTDPTVQNELQKAQFELMEKRAELEGAEIEIIFAESLPREAPVQRVKTSGQLTREKPGVEIQMLLRNAERFKKGEGIELFNGVMNVRTGELQFRSALVPHQDILGGISVVNPYQFHRIEVMSITVPFRHLLIDIATGFDTPQTLKYYSDLAFYPETTVLDGAVIHFSMTRKTYLFVHGVGLVDITKKYQELTFQKPSDANKQIQHLLEQAKNCGGKITGAATCPIAVYLKLEAALEEENINKKIQLLEEAKEILQQETPPISPAEAEETLTPEDIDIVIAQLREARKASPLEQLIQQITVPSIPSVVEGEISEIDILIDTLYDDSPEALIPALESITKQTNSLPPDHQLLARDRAKELLSHWHPAVAKRAIALLAEFGHPEDFPAVLEFIQQDEGAKNIIRNGLLFSKGEQILGIINYAYKRSQANIRALSSLAAFEHEAFTEIRKRIQVPGVVEGIIYWTVARGRSLFHPDVSASVNNNQRGFRNWIENDPQNAALLLFDPFPTPEEIIALSYNERQKIIRKIKEELTATRLAHTKQGKIVETFADGRVIKREFAEDPLFVHAKELKLKRLAQLLRDIGEQEAKELEEADRLLSEEREQFETAQYALTASESGEIDAILTEQPQLEHEAALVALDRLREELQLPAVLPEEVTPAVAEVKPALATKFDDETTKEVASHMGKALAMGTSGLMSMVGGSFIISWASFSAMWWEMFDVLKDGRELVVGTITDPEQRTLVESKLAAVEELLGIPPDKALNRAVPFEHLYTVARQVHKFRSELSDERIVSRLKELYNAGIYVWQIEQFEGFWVLPDIAQAVDIARSEFSIAYAKAFWDKGATIHDIAELSERYKTGEGQIAVDLMYSLLPNIEQFGMDDFRTLEKNIVAAEFDTLTNAYAPQVEEDAVERIKRLLPPEEISDEEQEQAAEEKQCKSPCKNRQEFMAALAQAAGLALTPEQREKAQSKGQIIYSLPNGVYVTQQAHAFLQQVVEAKFFASLLEFINPENAAYDKAQEALKQAEKEGKLQTALQRAVTELARAGIALQENNAFAAQQAIRNAVQEMDNTIKQQINTALKNKNYRQLVTIVAKPENKQAAAAAMEEAGLAELAPPYDPALYLKYAYAYAGDGGVRFLMDHVMQFAQQNNLKQGWALLYLARAYRIHPEYVKEMLNNRPHLATLEAFSDEELRVRSADMATREQLKRKLLVGDRIHGTSLNRLESIRLSGLEVSPSAEGEAVVAATEVDATTQKNLDLLDPLSYAIGRARGRADWPILLRIKRDFPEQPVPTGPGFNEVWYHKNIDPEYIEYFDPFTGEWSSVASITPSEKDNLQKKFTDAWKKQLMQVQAQDKLLANTNQIFMDTPQYTQIQPTRETKAETHAQAVISVPVKKPSMGRLFMDPFGFVAIYNFFSGLIYLFTPQPERPLLPMEVPLFINIKNLNSPDALVRETAINEIEKKGARAGAAVDPLIKMLRETRDDREKFYIIKALGTIGLAARGAIPDIIRIIKTKERKLMSVSVIALGNMYSAKAIPSLLTILNDETIDDNLLLDVVEALGKVGYEQIDAIAALDQLVRSNQYVGIRAKAVRALSGMGSRAMGSIVAVYFQEELRNIAKDVLLELRDSAYRREIAVLFGAYITPKYNKEINKDAISMVVAFGDWTEDIVPILVTAAREDKREDVRVKAVEALGLVSYTEENREDLINTIISVLEHDKNENIRKTAAVALGRIGQKISPEKRTQIIKALLLASYNPNERRTVRDTAEKAVVALGPPILEGPQEYPVLEQVLEKVGVDTKTAVVREPETIAALVTPENLLSITRELAELAKEKDLKTALGAVQTLHIVANEEKENIQRPARERLYAISQNLGEVYAPDVQDAAQDALRSPLQKEIATVKPITALTLTIGESTFTLPQLTTSQDIDGEGLLRLIANTAEWPVAEKQIIELLKKEGLEEGILVDSDGDFVLYVRDSAGEIKRIGKKEFEKEVSEKLNQPVQCGIGSGFCASSYKTQAQEIIESVGLENILKREKIDTGGYGILYIFPYSRRGITRELVLKVPRGLYEQTSVKYENQQYLNIQRFLLDHPQYMKFVPEYFGWYEKEGKFSLLIEYLRTAQPLMKSDKGRREKAKQYLPEFKQFIQALNQAGIVHGDIHDENILIKENGIPVLIDWGKNIGKTDDAEALEKVRKQYFEKIPSRVEQDFRGKRVLAFGERMNWPIRMKDNYGSDITILNTEYDTINLYKAYKQTFPQKMEGVGFLQQDYFQRFAVPEQYDVVTLNFPDYGEGVPNFPQLAENIDNAVKDDGVFYLVSEGKAGIFEGPITRGNEKLLAELQKRGFEIIVEDNAAKIVPGYDDIVEHTLHFPINLAHAWILKKGKKELIPEEASCKGGSLVCEVRFPQEITDELGVADQITQDLEMHTGEILPQPAISLSTDRTALIVTYATKKQFDYNALEKELENGLPGTIVHVAESVEELLKKDPNIILVERKAYPIPDIDYGIFPDVTRAMHLVSRLNAFLNGPVIEDTFGSRHGERVAWREKLLQEIRAYYETNSLRYNHIIKLTFSEWSIIRLYGGVSTLQQYENVWKAVEDIEQFYLTREEYNALSPKEKVAYVKNIKAAVYNLLRALEKKSLLEAEIEKAVPRTVPKPYKEISRVLLEIRETGESDFYKRTITTETRTEQGKEKTYILVDGKVVQGIKIEGDFAEITGEHYSSRAAAARIMDEEQIAQSADGFAYLVEPGKLAGKSPSEVRYILGSAAGDTGVKVTIRVPLHRIWIKSDKGKPFHTAIADGILAEDIVWGIEIKPVSETKPTAIPKGALRMEWWPLLAIPAYFINPLLGVGIGGGYLVWNAWNMLAEKKTKEEPRESALPPIPHNLKILRREGYGTPDFLGKGFWDKAESVQYENGVARISFPVDEEGRMTSTGFYSASFTVSKSPDNVNTITDVDLEHPEEIHPKTRAKMRQNLQAAVEAAKQEIPSEAYTRSGIIKLGTNEIYKIKTGEEPNPYVDLSLVTPAYYDKKLKTIVVNKDASEYKNLNKLHDLLAHERAHEWFDKIGQDAREQLLAEIKKNKQWNDIFLRLKRAFGDRIYIQTEMGAFDEFQAMAAGTVHRRLAQRLPEFVEEIVILPQQIKDAHKHILALTKELGYADLEPEVLRKPIKLTRGEPYEISPEDLMVGSVLYLGSSDPYESVKITIQQEGDQNFVEHDGKRYELKKEVPLTIGRSRDSTIVINEDFLSASRKHATIKKDAAGKVTVTDTSGNGVYVVPQEKTGQKIATTVKPISTLTVIIGEQTFSLQQLTTTQDIDGEGLLGLIANTAEWPIAEQQIIEVLKKEGLEEGVVVDSDDDIVLYVKDSAGILKKVGVKEFEKAVSDKVNQPVQCGIGSGFCAFKYKKQAEENIDEVPIVEPPDQRKLKQAVTRFYNNLPVTNEDIETILKQAVYEDRTYLISRYGKKALTGECVGGLCGLSQADLFYRIRFLSNERLILRIHQAETAFGIKPYVLQRDGQEYITTTKHAFLVATLDKNHKSYLIDTTYRQFFDTIHYREGELRYSGFLLKQIPESYKIIEDLLVNGYAELTPELIRYYGGSLRARSVEDIKTYTLPPDELSTKSSDEEIELSEEELVEQWGRGELILPFATQESAET